MQTPSFVDPSVVAEQTARMLLEIEAVNFQTDPPFTLTSGKKSPSYIDCRKIISFPRVRSIMMDFAVSTLAREVGAEAFDAVAGGETAGIPFSAFIAERLELPMNYVRKKPKKGSGEMHKLKARRWRASVSCWSKIWPPTAVAKCCLPNAARCRSHLCPYIRRLFTTFSPARANRWPNKVFSYTP